MSSKPLTASEVEVGDRLTSVAAPVLIGFAATLIGLVVSNSKDMRWPDVAVLALVASAVALVVSIQLYMQGRSNLVTEEEIAAIVTVGTDEQRRLTKEVQDQTFRRWSSYSRLCFYFGIAALFLGVAAVLLPTGRLCEANVLRLVAVGLALFGSLFNLGFGVAEEGRAKRAEGQRRTLQAKADALKRGAPPAPS